MTPAWRSLADAPLGEWVEVRLSDGSTGRAAFADTNDIIDAVQHGARAWRPMPQETR